MGESSFTSGNPEYRPASEKFLRTNAEESRAAEERRQAGMRKHAELLKARQLLDQKIEEIVAEMEGLVEEWGIEPTEPKGGIN
jgi:hypothetical protein